MIRHLYILQRESYCDFSREMIAVEDYLEVNNIIINNQNKIGIKLNNNYNSTLSITYLSILKSKSLKEFQRELQKIVNEKGISCKYIYNNKLYLCLAAPRKKVGVWRDNDLIIHQVGYPTIYREAEIVPLGDVKPTNVVVFGPGEYFELWKDNVEFLLRRRKPLHVAFFLGFVLAYTKYYYDLGGHAYNKNFPYHQLDCCRGIKDLGVVKDLTSAQFRKYVAPALNGDPEFGVLDYTFSMLDGAQLTKAYYNYIIPFWDKYFANK